MLDVSSANSSHVGNTQNKEEGKMKQLLSGSYDLIHRETGKMIQKKLFKRAFQLLEKFYQSRKDLELAEMIQINRRICYCINKLLKQHLLKPDLKQESCESLLFILERGNTAVFELYKYINLYMQKILPNERKGVVLEDVSHLSSSSSDEDRIKEKPVTVLKYKISEYNCKVRKVKRKLEVNVIDQQEISESIRIADMVQRSGKPLNINFELDQFWYNLIELLIKGGLIFKKAKKPKTAHFYLLEANRLADHMITCANPAIINLCAKSKIQLANFYYETGQYDWSLKYAEEALTICQGEMRLRNSQDLFAAKQNKNRDWKRIKKCIITTLSAFITMLVNYEATHNFQRLLETLTTQAWVCDKYMQGIDEFKKHILKLSAEGQHRMDGFKKDVKDLTTIAEQVFENELYKLKRNFDEKRNIENESDYQKLQKFNEQMYNLFQVKFTNRQCFFKEQNEEKQIIMPPPDVKLVPQNKTERSINIFDSQDSEDSFFDASFFAPSIYEDEVEIKTTTKRKKQRKPAPPKVLPGKSVGLIKIGLERPQDYKSKILTTTHYFQQYPVQEKTERKFVDTGKEFQRKLQNIQYREHPENNNQQDLDVYTEKMVAGKILTGGIRDYETIGKDLGKLRKKEDFDKKEFNFGRRMLMLKSKEALRQPKQNGQSVPVAIEIDTKIQNHAFITDGRIIGEKDLKELKRKKIDKMVAGKKMVKSTVDLKDPEEANYLKKVLEESKKKQLKDLIFKHREVLGLSKFFLNLLREQKEQEKMNKLKSIVSEFQIISSQEGIPSSLKIVHQQSPPVLSPRQKQSIKKQTSTVVLPKKMIVKTGSVHKSREISQHVSEITGVDLILLQQQQAENKKARLEQIERQQQKSHNVIAMIADGVEKKMDAENKELKKLLFAKQGGSKQYIDDDAPTYLKFMPRYTDLHRSTYLMFIKKELAEKPQFTFDDVAFYRMQLTKKVNSDN